MRGTIKMADGRANEEKNEKDKTEETYTSQDRSEYFGKLEKWLQEAYAWQSVAAMFPYHLLAGQILNRPNGETPLVTQNVNAPLVTDETRRIADTPEGQNTHPVRQRTLREPRVPRPPRDEGYQYRIPPIWKRFVAEFIDSMILLVLKLVITYYTIDLSEFISQEPYELDVLQSNLRIDYKMAVEFAAKVLIWEVLHRFIVCVFEAIWLQHGMNGTIGGASPGKYFMGLIVVQCRSITPLEGPDNDNLVFVSPGTDLGLPLALGRSIVKNLIMTFLFPICFALFFFRFNRTGYDLACNSIVVEDPLRN